MKSKILLTVFLLLSVPFVALADDSLTENFIPFTAIVTPFVALLLALFFFWLYSYRKEQIRAQVIEKALENGRDLPDDFWAAKKKTKPFKEEITYLGIGLGFLFMGYMSGEFVFTGVAIIFLIMGVGGLLVYWLRKSSKETNKDDSDNEEQ